MKLPNKVTSYSESTLSRLAPILTTLSMGDKTVIEVYQYTHLQYQSLEEYIDALDCLFALGKIEYIEESRVLHFVT